jgi:diguanylate cyclase (GGDEF)-like protein
MLEESTAGTLETVVGIAYPALDLVAAAVLVRLLLGRPRGQVALTLVTLAVAVTLVADFVYNVLVINGMEESTPGWLEMLYLGGILLLTAAGAAPDSGRIAVAVERERPGISTARTVGLSVAILTAPLLMALVAWGEGGSTARLLAVMSVAVIALVVGRTMLLLSTVERQAQRLAEQARTDSLTGLPNRRTWDFQLERAATTTARENAPLTVAMLDLDHFKAYNDLNGHPAGDELLVQCGRAWRLQLPRSAFLARYGGEEFAVLLPGVRADDAVDVLDRLRRATPGHQSVSIGYAERLPGETARQTLDRADRALYVAKEDGRDRIEAAEVPVLDDTAG